MSPSRASTTGIWVARPIISASMLSRLGGRWVTTTKPMPLSAGVDLKKRSSASTPPAEAPMPTIGRLGITAVLRVLLQLLLTADRSVVTRRFCDKKLRAAYSAEPRAAPSLQRRSDAPGGHLLSR